jgi:O-antigen/teichoic acid export membrane protein
VAFLDMGILATKRLSYHIYLFWGCLALNVLLNLWWVPPFGYMGAAWATLVSYAVLSCAVYLVSNRLMAVATEPGRLLAAASSAVFTIVAGLSVPLSGVASIVTRCALLLGLLGLWWRFVLSADERAGGRQAVSRVLHSGVFRRRRVS